MDSVKERTAERRTSDLPLAAYLALHHQLRRIEPNGGGRSTFVFEATEELEQDTLLFLSRRATVEPITFLEQVRSLKGGLR
jgi:hypothetical protein